jgi:hypothetical protein
MSASAAIVSGSSGQSPPAARCIDAYRHAVQTGPFLPMPQAKQPQIDRIGHGLVTSIVGMKVVSAVILRQQSGRGGRVAHGGIKIDRCVEPAAGDSARAASLLPYLCLSVIAKMRQSY